MEYQDQSASGLRLNLVEGHLPLDQFTILQRMTCAHAEAKVEAMIIGASHVVTFTNGDQMWHEVFACCEVQAGSKILLCGPLASLNGKVDLVLRGGFTYRFQLEVFNGKEAKRKTEEMEIMARQTKQVISFEFPKGNLPYSPKTIVVVDGIGAVRLTTAHSYPNEETVVITKTHFFQGGGNQ